MAKRTKFDIVFSIKHIVEADNQQEAFDIASTELKDMIPSGEFNVIDVFDFDIKEDKEPVYSENYPVTFDDKGMRDFLQENFEAYFKNIILTDEELDQFKRHLEASLSDWISENWRDFTENRGD